MDLKTISITFADVAAGYLWNVWQRFTGVLKPLKFNWYKVTFGVFYFVYLNKIFLQMYEAIPIAAAELTAAGVRVYPHQQTASFGAWWLAYIAANVAFYVVVPIIMDYLTPTVTAQRSEYLPIKMLHNLAANGSLFGIVSDTLAPVKPYQVADIDAEIKRKIEGSLHNEQEVLVSRLPKWYAVLDNEIIPITDLSPSPTVLDPFQ